MSRLAATVVLLLGAAALTPRPAQAQRREGEVASPLVLELPYAVRFGDTVVPPGSYQVSLVDGHLGLVHTDSMVVALAADVTVVEAEAGGAAASLRESADVVELAVTGPAGRAVLRGRKLGAVAASPSPVQYAAKVEDDAEGAPQSLRVTDEAAVDGALAHLLPYVAHCGEAVRRGQWGTDDPRFVRCVCPIVKRWRLPRVSAALRVHRPLPAERAGWSITVKPDGHVQDCRVWRGASSPELLPPPVAPTAPSAATPPATPPAAAPPAP
jgi:hypothetical protein